MSVKVTCRTCGRVISRFHTVKCLFCGKTGCVVSIGFSNQYKHGRYKGKQRLKCKRCNRTFNLPDNEKSLPRFKNIEELREYVKNANLEG